MITHSVTFTATCDECKQHSITINNMSRINSIKEMRRQGWVIGQNGDKCICPDCRDKVDTKDTTPKKERKPREKKVKIEKVTPKEEPITINQVIAQTGVTDKVNA